MQICSLVEYMHSACKTPILHLDLQPNNLIIHNGIVRLIDFDHAAGCETVDIGGKRYGTVGCAAPEQYDSDRVLDVRTDIYAIGAVLRFMLQGTQTPGAGSCPSISEPLDRIIRKCMEQDMEDRFASARDAADALRRLPVSKEAAGTAIEASPSLNVILAGSRSGAGTTHLAFGLCRFLTKKHYKTLYEEHNRSMAVRTLSSLYRARPDSYGIYHIEGCYMKPWYGPAAKLPKPEGFSIVLKDFGTHWREAGQSLHTSKGLLMAVVSESSWERGQTARMLEEIGLGRAGDRSPIYVVLRHADEKYKKRKALLGALEKHREIMLFRSPEYPDPFKKSLPSESFFKALWNAAGQNSLREEKGGL